MRVVVQRVARASVAVGGSEIARIGRGLLLLVAIEPGDDAAIVDAAADKLSSLRVFGDAEGRMNLDVRQAGGAVLVVSQFTLAASLRRGRRPSFEGAAPPHVAEPLVASLAESFRARGLEVAEGAFGADMSVDLTNDGPVTFVLDLPFR